jgi:hypothetical protein
MRQVLYKRPPGFVDPLLKDEGDSEIKIDDNGSESSIDNDELLDILNGNNNKFSKMIDDKRSKSTAGHVNRIREYKKEINSQNNVASSLSRVSTADVGSFVDSKIIKDNSKQSWKSKSMTQLSKIYNTNNNNKQNKKTKNSPIKPKINLAKKIFKTEGDNSYEEDMFNSTDDDKNDSNKTVLVTVQRYIRVATEEPKNKNNNKFSILADLHCWYHKQSQSIVISAISLEENKTMIEAEAEISLSDLNSLRNDDDDDNNINNVNDNVESNEVKNENKSENVAKNVNSEDSLKKIATQVVKFLELKIDEFGNARIILNLTPNAGGDDDDIEKFLVSQNSNNNHNLTTFSKEEKSSSENNKNFHENNKNFVTSQNNNDDDDNEKVKLNKEKNKILDYEQYQKYDSNIFSESYVAAIAKNPIQVLPHTNFISNTNNNNNNNNNNSNTFITTSSIVANIDSYNNSHNNFHQNSNLSINILNSSSSGSIKKNSNENFKVNDKNLNNNNQDYMKGFFIIDIYFFKHFIKYFFY